MKILIATDGSKFSEAAIEKCCQMFEKSENTDIRIISTGELAATFGTEPFAISADYINDMNTATRKQANEIASQAHAQIQKNFPSLTNKLTTMAEMGSPAQAIIAEAEKWGADLIVVGSHGRGFWERMFIGSVSQAVIQHAPCSVLVVKNPVNDK